jgi:hypothetical protein
MAVKISQVDVSLYILIPSNIFLQSSMYMYHAMVPAEKQVTQNKRVDRKLLRYQPSICSVNKGKEGFPVHKCFRSQVY